MAMIALLHRAPISCTILAPSTSELTEYIATLVPAFRILASRNALIRAVAMCERGLPFCCSQTRSTALATPSR